MEFGKRKERDDGRDAMWQWEGGVRCDEWHMGKGKKGKMNGIWRKEGGEDGMNEIEYGERKEREDWMNVLWVRDGEGRWENRQTSRGKCQIPF